MKLNTTIRVIFGCLCALPLLVSAATQNEEVRAFIGQTFDRPDAQVVIDPVVIEQNYALADWVQGKNGGRALLRRGEQNWEILLCAGDALKKASTIQAAGVPEEIAYTLQSKLAEAESALPAQQVKLFSRFRAKQQQPARGHHH